MRPAALTSWVCLLMAGSPSAAGQVHFTDCVDGAGNINNATLVVSEDSAPNIDGEPLAFGSEIAVFSAANGLCAGVTAWDGGNTIITVWGNDDQTAEIEGMVSGEPLDIRVWDVAGDREFSGGRVEVGWQSGPGLNDTGLYQNDALMVITHLGLTVIDPPPVPTLVLPADDAVTGPTITLDWSSVAGATSYHLQVDDSPSFDSPHVDLTGIVQSASGVANLPIDVIWFWRVRAFGEGGFGEWSSVRSFTTVSLPDPPQLTWPQDAAVDVSVPTALFWTSVPDASYRLQVARSSGFNDPVVDRADLTSPSITGLALAYETTYHWRLRSVGASGSGSWSTARRFTTESEPPPPAPGLVDPFDGATNVDTRQTLDWSESARATGYRIQIATGFEFIETVLDESVTSSEYPPAPGLLAAATTYWWRVRAISDRGEGEWSASYSFTTAAATNRVDDPEVDRPASGPRLSVWPNPVRSTAEIEIVLQRSSPVELGVFDLLGREIDVPVSGTLSPGVHRFEWQADGHPNGIYLARLVLPATTLVMTVTVAR